ncbi:CPCC family cysteine-rich protein [Brevibacillus fortis]|uniref:CPCC family cysteine-rich protein n=1 Tax=Brevibacillus fortis TaxID=2126352 RepID=UPI002E1EFE62|nr:CPCC family cysteine-rich protein [Brevibacillus fortis]
MATEKYTCPCCGYKTLDEEPPGTYIICKICFWEDDPVQFDDPDYGGGANIPSLRQAQHNFVEFGSCEERCIPFVRNPTIADLRDPNWSPLSLTK